MRKNELLKACYSVFNQIPRTKITHPVFKDTYQLAAALGDSLRKSESEPKKPKK